MPGATVPISAQCCGTQRGDLGVAHTQASNIGERKGNIYSENGFPSLLIMLLCQQYYLWVY